MGLRINVALHYGEKGKRVIYAQANSRTMGVGEVKQMCRSLKELSGQPTAQLAWLLSQKEVSPSSVGYGPLFLLGEPHEDQDYDISVTAEDVVMVRRD